MMKDLMHTLQHSLSSVDCDDKLKKADSYQPYNRIYSELNVEGYNHEQSDDFGNQDDE